MDLLAPATQASTSFDRQINTAFGKTTPHKALRMLRRASALASVTVSKNKIGCKAVSGPATLTQPGCKEQADCHNVDEVSPSFAINGVERASHRRQDRQTTPQPAAKPPPADSYPAEFGVPNLPKGRSRNAIYLCQAEWAWTPDHNRLEAYYLARGRRHWLLWRGFHNDGTIPQSCEWGIVALVAHEGVAERRAASLLLASYWAFQRDDSNLDRYHWLNDTADLDVGDVEGIARDVWGDDDQVAYDNLRGRHVPVARRRLIQCRTGFLTPMHVLRPRFRTTRLRQEPRNQAG